MKALRLGELCAGYGGLGMAVEEVFNADTAWFSEFDTAPSKILAHHWPDVPNHGDMTKIDWAAIEPVDIISGGTPCQDLSAAGRRAGMTEGTRSNLWVQMREAIAIQKPKYVVWENVRGAYSASADSDLEQCPGCVGDPGDGRVVLRALGRVLGDLSDLGYDTQWRGLRAADVGACHGRFRVFVLASNRNRLRHERPRDARGRWTRFADSGFTLPDTASDRWREGWTEPKGIVRGLHASSDRQAAADSEGRRRGICEPHDFRPASRELDAPRNDCAFAGGETRTSTDWGNYQPAISRWETVMGRRAPAPTELNSRGGHRLSPRFTEWMMGLPNGWVTDPAIGITRNEQLKACGNGVVPQQAMAALRDMLAAFQMVEVAA